MGMFEEIGAMLDIELQKTKDEYLKSSTLDKNSFDLPHKIQEIEKMKKTLNDIKALLNV